MCCEAARKPVVDTSGSGSPGLYDGAPRTIEPAAKRTTIPA